MSRLAIHSELPLEFKSPETIRIAEGVHRDIKGTGSFGHSPGEGTDDSDLTFGVARAYEAGFSLEEVAENFLAWKRGGPRDIGGATASGLARLASIRSLNSEFEQTKQPLIKLTNAGSAAEPSCGNGSLMRTVAVGLAEDDEERRWQTARDVSALTHAHPRCLESCALYSDLVGRLIDIEASPGPDARPEVVEAFQETRSSGYWRIAARYKNDEEWDDHDPEVEAYDSFCDGFAYYDENAQDGGLSTFGTSGYVLDGLSLATWALRRSIDVGPEQALIEVVNRGGDADTNGAIVGGLLGAAWGTGHWPERWIEKVDYGEEATELGSVLTDVRAGDWTPKPGIRPRVFGRKHEYGLGIPFTFAGNGVALGNSPTRLPEETRTALSELDYYLPLDEAQDESDLAEDDEDFALDNAFNKKHFDGKGDVFDNVYKLKASEIRELYYAGEISEGLALDVLEAQADQGDPSANDTLLELEPELMSEAEFDMDDEEEFLPDELVTSDLPAVDLLTGEILERSGPSELDGMLSTPADAMSFEIDELMDDREFALDPGLVGADEGVLGLYTEPIPLWRRVLGLGPAPERNPKICNHWMPIARKRCVLRAGHPASVHHASVIRRRP